MNENRFEIEFDDSGNICVLQFSGEKLHDEFEFLKLIAPYVESGGYCEMSGEEGCQWRWVFDGKTCHEIFATITWPEI